MEVMENNRQSRQDVPKYVLLRGSQSCREFDIDTNNKVASLGGFLGDDHAVAGVMLLGSGLSRTSFGYANRFAINRFHDTIPAGKGFLEGEVDGCDEIITLTLEDGMWFLQNKS